MQPYSQPLLALPAYNPPSNFAIDGTAGGQFSTTNTGTVTLTTTSANDVIILMYYHQDSQHNNTTSTISSVASTHLTWTKRKQFGWSEAAGTDEQNIEIWWAVAASALTSEVITITLTSAIDDAAYQAFGISGVANPNSPWDANASHPAGAHVLNQTSNTVSGITSNVAKNMVIGCWGSFQNITVTNPSGTTAVRAQQSNNGGVFFAHMQSFYEINTSALSSASFQTTQGSSSTWGMLIDVLK
jgi:hypothetical protein